MAPGVTKGVSELMKTYTIAALTEVIYYKNTLREKCPCSELFWSLFSGIWTEYREIFCISPYSI